MFNRVKADDVQSEADVLEWFQTSTDSGLRSLAPELRQIFDFEGPSAPATALVSSLQPLILLNLSRIINANGQFKRGANATIAEILFNDRTATGGSKNRQIQAIKQEVGQLFATTPNASQKAA